MISSDLEVLKWRKIRVSTSSTSVSSYAHPEVLAETGWLQKNLENPNIRILEVDYDSENAYKQGHIPGAHLVEWKKDINDPIRRDIISKEHFEQFLSNIGATPETQLVLYGDFNSWFAAFAFWVFQYYGHKNTKSWTVVERSGN
ncbi:MAG TPA: rhodanese-like domain-containing protein [Nitrososphaera sp.]|jgi:thiosulfate/3-mercaptopyruvate sulfurtransferase